MDKTTIEDDIPLLCITPSNPPEKEDARSMYVQEDQSESDERGVRLPKVYPLATETGGRYENDRKGHKSSLTSSRVTHTGAKLHLEWNFRDLRRATKGNES